MVFGHEHAIVALGSIGQSGPLKSREAELTLHGMQGQRQPQAFGQGTAAQGGRQHHGGGARDHAAVTGQQAPRAVVPLDGSDGITLVAPWDGHGMAATQSHALSFDGARAVRFAWPGHLRDLIGNAGPFFGTLFTAIVLGIVEEAVDTARQQLAPKAEDIRAYERVGFLPAKH